MKLFDLYQKFFELHDKIEEQYGEVTEEDLKSEQEIEESLEWHLDNQATRFTEAKAEAEKCKELSRRYSDRQKSFEKTMDFRKKIIEFFIWHRLR